MRTDGQNVQLVGFENDAGVGALLAEFGLFEDYRVMLPEHLLGILRRQYPDVAIETIEFRGSKNCNLGGIQNEDRKNFIRVQALDMPFDLRLTVRAGGGWFELDIELVLICEGLDSTPTVRSDMFVRAQRALT